MAEQACGAGAMAYLGGSNRLGPCADALEPIEVLFRTFVQVNLVGADFGFEDGGVGGV